MMTNPINSYEAFIERVWTDEDFKNLFKRDPKLILAEVGVKVPDSSVKVEWQRCLFAPADDQKRDRPLCLVWWEEP